MQTPSSPHSPPYPFYTPPSSPSPLPWQSYPMVNLPIQPGFHTSVEPVLNACSERPVGGFLSSVMGGTVSQGVAVTEDFSCQGQAWQMEQRDHYTSMEDSMGLAQQILEADVLVFDQSIQDPHCTIDMEQYPDRDINYAETSGRKSICEPYIGLEFRSEGEAYEFYKAYAKENGFSIRKSHVERSRVDHSLISRKYVCVRQGFRSLKDKRYEGKVVRHRRVTRIDCRAAMIVKRRSGKWVVHRFHKEHNHDLGDLATTCELQSLRKMTNSTKSILEALYKTQCIDMEDNIVLGQNVLEASRVVSDNCTQEHQHSTNVLEANMVVSDDGIQEHEYSDNVSEDMVKCDNVIQEQQHSTNVEESLKEDADTDETIGTKGIAMHESTIGDRNTAETTERDDNNASLVKLGSEPYMSLQFGSQDEAYEFYNAYAKEKGFSIRKSRIERSRIDHSMISRLYVCANQGLRSTKDKRYEGKDVRPRQETRLDCHAAMFIKRKAGKWVVERFHKEHNHDFVDPAKAEKLRSHRKMANTTKLMVEALYKCGLGPSKIVDLLTGIADGAKEILENNELDCENDLKKERKNNIRVECYRMLDYFQGAQAEDPEFFYAIEIGENRCMRSIFWADGKAREAYKQFGDMLVFEAVCKTNKYLSPFVSFSGLNHHQQPVLFGCGFLADETVESFVWLFGTWLRAMSDQQPISIITNQDRSIKIAIEKIFPDTRHRFCLCHIEKDETENLSHVFDMHIDFHSEYKKCIYSSRTPKEFETGWEALLLKYHLKENKWLNKLYNQRQYWVPLYLQNTFFGGMNKIPSYFDGFMHKGTPLGNFIQQYELAIKRRREDEVNEDFSTVCTRACLTSKNPIEEQAARVYTRNMFTIFKNEFVESSGCTARKISEESSISKYMVGKYKDKDGKAHIVMFDSVDNGVSCSCQMFDSGGMLCRHTLKVFQAVDIFEIPHRYILNRWTMSGRYLESCIDAAPNILTLKDTTKSFVKLGETSKERSKVAISILQEGMQELSLINVSTATMPLNNLGCSSAQDGHIDQSESSWMMDLNISVPDAPQVKLRGRPVSSRMKLGPEVHKKKRTCGTCKEAGHYTRTCPKGAIDPSQTSTMFQRHVDASRNSILMHTPSDDSDNSMLLHGPGHQSQTSMMLQETFGQPHIFTML